MKMSEKTLLKKIEQAFAENCCNGTYNSAYYMLYYTYETGETIAVDISVSYLGEVKFYSYVHHYYISNFNYHIKSVINVLRMLFDMIDSNKDIMIKYNEIAETEETEEPEETEKHYADYTSEDFIKAGIAKECTTCPDFCEEDCIENAECSRGNDVFEGCKTVKEVMKAKSNPDWHHVSLAALANIDNNMLDDKRRLYLTVLGELNKTLKNLHKCNSGLSYERALSPLRRWVLELYHNKKITGNFKRYVYIKISMCNVECGVWPSAFEVATGRHASRKYNRATLRH